MDDAINKDEVCPEVAAFNWLLISGALESLREQCNFYDTETSDCKMERKIFTLVLNMDVGYLLEYDAHLGNIVCNHPQKAKELFQEACFVCIRTLNWNRHVTSISQINPQIRYTCLPRYIREIMETNSGEMPLFSTIGLVIDMTTPESYIKTSCFECKNSLCSFEFGTGFDKFSNEFQSDMICTECGLPLDEDISCRILGEHCKLRIVSCDQLKSYSSTCYLNRSILVCVRDELLDNVQLGSIYSFSLIPHRKSFTSPSTHVDIIFEVNNLTKVNYSMLNVSFNLKRISTIRTLYQECGEYPWTFATRLAYIFCGHSLSYSTCNDLCFSISADQRNNNTCIIHGGCLLLASDGVCLVNNLKQLKSKEMTQLENALQTECVTIDIPKRLINQNKNQISVPVSCKLWACYEPTADKQRPKCNPNTTESGHLSKNFVDNFSLVYIMTEDSFDEQFAEDLLVQNTLRKCTAMAEDGSLISCVSDEEFYQFLQYAAKIKPSFSREASNLIQGFYVASRRSRSSGLTNGMNFPLPALKSMTSIAEAHAKLSLRSEVTEDDAVVAILLYEECITARLGYSVLGVRQFHHFKNDTLASFINIQNEKLSQLKRQMKRFCHLHSNYKHASSSINREE